ncbi:hypothetical protein RBB50_007778 [Rhinocladiella similis]
MTKAKEVDAALTRPQLVRLKDAGVAEQKSQVEATNELKGFSAALKELGSPDQTTVRRHPQLPGVAATMPPQAVQPPVRSLGPVSPRMQQTMKGISRSGSPVRHQ